MSTCIQTLALCGLHDCFGHDDKEKPGNRQAALRKILATKLKVELDGGKFTAVRDQLQASDAFNLGDKSPILTGHEAMWVQNT